MFWAAVLSFILMIAFSWILAYFTINWGDLGRSGILLFWS